MLSRVADNLYWMSRYLERAEHTARVIGVHLNLMLEHDPVRRNAAGSAWYRAWARTTRPLEGDASQPPQTFALRADRGRRSRRRAKMRARCASRSAPRCGKRLNRLFHESKRIGTPERSSAQPLRPGYTVITKARICSRASPIPP